MFEMVEKVNDDVGSGMGMVGILKRMSDCKEREQTLLSVNNVVKRTIGCEVKVKARILHSGRRGSQVEGDFQITQIQ